MHEVCGRKSTPSFFLASCLGDDLNKPARRSRREIAGTEGAMTRLFPFIRGQRTNGRFAFARPGRPSGSRLTCILFGKLNPFTCKLGSGAQTAGDKRSVLRDTRTHTYKYRPVFFSPSLFCFICKMLRTNTSRPFSLTQPYWSCTQTFPKLVALHTSAPSHLDSNSLFLAFPLLTPCLWVASGL